MSAPRASAKPQVGAVQAASSPSELPPRVRNDRHSLGMKPHRKWWERPPQSSFAAGCLSSGAKPASVMFGSANPTSMLMLLLLVATMSSLRASALSSQLQQQQQTTIYQQHAADQPSHSSVIATPEEEAIQQGTAASQSTNGPELELPTSAIQMALVSARGVLAFQRAPSDADASDGSGWSASSAAKLALEQLGTSFEQGDCLQLSGLSARMRQLQHKLVANRRPVAANTLAAKPPEVDETQQPTTPVGATIVAVEGSTFKLNIVILGHRLAAPSAPDAHNNHLANRSKQALVDEPMPRLRLQWTRNNGQPMAVNAPRGRFSQQLINENDIMRQFFSGQQATSGGQATQSLLSTSSRLQSAHQQAQQQQQQQQHPSANPSVPPIDQHTYWLAPYANEPALAQLAEQQGRAKLYAGQTSGKLHVADDFIQDGQSVGWTRLETYLRLSARELNLYLPAHQATAPTSAPGRPQQQQQHSSCPSVHLAPSIEQLAILQLELTRPLQLDDRGVYSLRACHSPTNCQSLAFTLQVLDDVPKLEGPSVNGQPLMQQQQQQLPVRRVVLEPGDRLSIKCEATGFTLPQISWFLDGQQLNEHHASAAGQLVGHGAPPTTGSLLELGSLGGRLRIGDYVSHEQRVHSFVNSSQVEQGDGGFYKCQANNGFHSVEQETRIDVRGPPVIARQLQNVSVLINQPHLAIQCPFSGYPISAVEWYYRPQAAPAGQAYSQRTYLLDYPAPDPSRGQLRARRHEAATRESDPTGSYLDSASGRSQQLQLLAALDSDQEQDPERDEWLSQASAMTPSSQDDYPEPVPEYPASQVVGAGGSSASASASLMVPAADDYELDSALPADRAELLDATSALDYDLEPVQQQSRRRRRKREAQHQQPASEWIKFPQSRRHQVHLNGTLVIRDVSRTDQGFYKCRALGPPVSTANGATHHELAELDGSQSASSNELFLTVLQPPVISPFSSASSLREGMRNFLTCSVIEGDSPVRLSWFKDAQPIEEYIQQQQPSPSQSHSDAAAGSRIRVETSNEYTSTLYFSHVDFKDNGNYTCMAANKAASVNYTARMLVNVPPKWIKAPKDVECVAGQNIVIDCQAEAHPNVRIWWEIGAHSAEHLQQQQSAIKETNVHAGSKAGANVAMSPAAIEPLAASNAPHSEHPPTHYRTIISNSRIHILENASLVIRDVNKLDQGYYLCQAANNFGSLSSLIKLTVNVGASFASKYLVKYVKLNEMIELDCDPIGHSPVEVIWLMRELPVQSTTGAGPSAASGGLHLATNQKNLTQNSLSQAAPSISSLMHHQHHLQAATNQSNDQHLTQQRPAGLGRRLFMRSIRTELQHQPALASAGSNNKLIGQQSQQTTTVSEFLDHEAAILFEVLRRQESQSEFVRLVIKQARRAHSADFVCQASNRFGADEKLIKLLVQEPPDPVHEIRLLQVAARSVSLDWTPPFNGNSPITGYTIEWARAVTADQHRAPLLGEQHSRQSKSWTHIPVQQPAATLVGLQPMTSYEIRIRAANHFGQSVAGTYTALVTTAEEAPNGPPGDVRAVPLSSSSFELSWMPPEYQQESQSIAAAAAADQDSALTTTQRFTIKGYYIGYKVAGSNESFVFKDMTANQQQQHLVPSEHDMLEARLAPSTRTEIGAGQQIAASGTNQKLSAGRLRVVIGDLKRATKYTAFVQAFNSAGSGPQSDQVEVKTLLNDPPPAPMLRVGTVGYTSIELQWSFSQATASVHQSTSTDLLLLDSGVQLLSASDGQATTGRRQPAFGSNDPMTATDLGAIDGFNLYYKSALDPSGQWIEKRLSPDTHTLVGSTAGESIRTSGGELSVVELSSIKSSQQPAGHVIGWHASPNSTSVPMTHRSFRYSLDQLACGNPYQLYLFAHNSIGSGAPSSIIRTKTRGSAPIAPRKQDYIVANSTRVQLNLETWMDGGCSITNFEIRYRQMQSRSDAAQQQPQWVLLSNSISPEERSIELRDLQPETWYSIETVAESAAGKTEIQYSFMTLDKFGRLPAEAVESSLPALFRGGNNSIRSILYNFSSPNSSFLMSPFVMGVSMFLLLFATCSLFLIRRYNNLIKDNASIDSQATTTCTAPTSSHYHTHNQHRLRHNQLQLAEAKLGQMQDHYGALGDGTTLGEHYSMKASPCKTNTTNATIVTGSSLSTTNGSSGVMMSGSSICNDNNYQTDQTTLDLSQFPSGGQQCQFHPNQQYQQQQPHQCDDVMHCESPMMQASKFATLSREAAAGLIAGNSPQANNRFRTMPHRPVSTFIGPSQHHQAEVLTNGMHGHSPRYVFADPSQPMNQHDHYNQHQQHTASPDQQQIYSKLRLMYNSNSNYNICPDSHKTDQQLQQPVDGIQLPYDANTLNLALMTQQNHQKLLSYTLKRQSAGVPGYQMASDTGCSNLMQESNHGELGTLLMDCQHQQQQHNQYDHVNQQQQQQQLFHPSNQVQHQQMLGTLDEQQLVNSTNGVAYGSSSVASVTASNATNSSQPTTNSNSSSATSNVCETDAGQCSKNNAQQKMAAGGYQQGQTGGSQATQQGASGAANGSTNEQSDYAMPFPPKWV